MVCIGALYFGFAVLVNALSYGGWPRKKIGIDACLFVPLGALSGGVAWLYLNHIGPWLAAGPYFQTVFGFPAVLALFSLLSTVLIGIAGEYLKDEDREWFARIGAWLLIVSVLWVALSAFVLLGPGLLKYSAHLLPYIQGLAGTSLLASIWGGLTSKGRGTGKPSGIAAWLNDHIIPILGLVTTLLIGLCVLWGLQPLLARMPNSCCASLGHWAYVEAVRLNLPSNPAWCIFLLIFAFGGISFALSHLIPLNRFSLHALYRNRLIRAYLGASNPHRNPSPFTGFDPDDNLPMEQLRDCNHRIDPNNPASPYKLFHVVNMALNLTFGEDLAWQERKALSFTASPLHSGSFFLGVPSHGLLRRGKGPNPWHRHHYFGGRRQPQHGLPQFTPHGLRHDLL